ncbi:hypothetical protein B9N43_15315 [Denitratisoma sp. DHT3]|uniref:hypothetical protein n=1 Tax=Denitratisoma sp. DHT3 TaxID=1981880 RepID=UPI001198C9B3|nr:hypothetical protein [Denitratisoma sp. DHT3]QDX82482.1 hypothetical protein B9N43_15315 [Denitratisoma sp. DHT3]
MKRSSLTLWTGLLLPLAASAGDLSLSGFGTVGYARSDQPYKYLRYVDDQGTFDRDSVFGVQVDAKIAPEWSATAQLKLAPAVGNDNRWDARLAWAFVSWRPDNDWLLRLGKIRVPGYLNSENMDVGATYDYVRLPHEVYSVSPTYDFNGASFNRTFGLADGDLVLDGYWGRTDTKWRLHFRDGIPGVLPPGPQFTPVEVESKGLALTWRRNDDTYLAFFHQASGKSPIGQRWTLPVLVTPAPGISYYTSQPGPGVPSWETLEMNIFGMGADVGLGNGVRLAAEYVRRRAPDIPQGVNSDGAYVSLRRHVGPWTPYVLYSRLRTETGLLDLYQTVNNAAVPSFVPGAAVINASQRMEADKFAGYDQSSWAVGTSYALTPTRKIKAEWMRTRTGVASSFIDAPIGGNSGGQRVNVFSLSYSFTF